jgi:hypothetical protein
MSCASNNEEATTATIGCVHDRSDYYYSDEETDWQADDRESAYKLRRDRIVRVKCAQDRQQWEKETYQRAANVKLEEAKKSELHYKMLINLLNEK